MVSSRLQRLFLMALLSVIVLMLTLSSLGTDFALISRLKIRLGDKTTTAIKAEQPQPEQQNDKAEREGDYVPVFYNLFVGSEADLPRVERIVQEQLAHFLPAHRAFVHSIGVPMDIPDKMELLQHHDQGNEVETLRSLWEYCKIRPTSKVVYLHSKGSFHATPENDALRVFLTEGALSQECLELPNDCSVCSSRMSPIPHPHTPGNMWLARCAYIKRLIDPRLFEDRLQSTPGLENIRHSPCHGLGRFAAEHWVHSHPTVMQCDVSADPRYAWKYNNIPSSDFVKDLSMAPRFEKESYRLGGGCQGIGWSMDDRLVEYSHLYNETPPETWWGWRFYNTTL